MALAALADHPFETRSNVAIQIAKRHDWPQCQMCQWMCAWPFLWVHVKHPPAPLLLWLADPCSCLPCILFFYFLPFWSGLFLNKNSSATASIWMKTCKMSISPPGLCQKEGKELASPLLSGCCSYSNKRVCHLKAGLRGRGGIKSQVPKNNWDGKGPLKDLPCPLIKAGPFSKLTFSVSILSESKLCIFTCVFCRYQLGM